MQYEQKLKRKNPEESIQRFLLIWFIFFSYFNVFQISQYSAVILLLIVAAIPILTMLKNLTIPKNRYGGLWIFYTVVCCLQSILPNALSRAIAWSLQKILLLILLLYCLRHICDLRKMMKALLIGAMVHVIATIAEYFAPDAIQTLQTSLNGSKSDVTQELYLYGYHCGITLQAGFNAVYISVAVVILFANTMVNKIKGNLINIVLLVIAIAALLLSGKRGMLVAIAVAIVVVTILYLYDQKKLKFGQFLVFLLGTLAVYYMIMYTDIAENIIRRSEYGDDFLSGRDVIWTRAMEGIRKNPIFGNGTGSYSLIHTSSVHNSFLHAWYENGLIGLVLLVGAMFAAGFAGVSALRKCKNPRNKGYVLAALSYQIFFAVACFTDHLMQYNSLMACYFIFAAVPYVAVTQEKQEKI